MLFNSIHFLVFFPLVVAIYFAIPYRFRWVLLLGASYYFYMCWKPEYVLLILVSTISTYYISLKMAKKEVKSQRNGYLILALVVNLGILFAFKYFNFINDSIRTVFNHYNIFYGIPAFRVLLPVGISFYTFQTLSYLIDVYRGDTKPEKHPGIFALYVAFFPQLVSGPIERSTRLLPQFYRQHDFDYQRVTNGLKLMLWGFLKKLVIADRLAIYVNEAYNNPQNYHGAPLILATYFFAFQIYCDFSGYSDIAIGGAQVMGYNLMENFRRPYFSESISDFWKRWHISLSSWFRDYLYIPLGGNRVTKWRWYYNLFVVFLISGLWHGANWTFLVWGALHGFYLIFSIWTQSYRQHICNFLRINRFPTIHRCLKVFITFHLVLFAWIFFRANSISDAFLIIRHIPKIDVSKLNVNIALGRLELLIAFAAISVMEFMHLLQRNNGIREQISRYPAWFRYALYYVAVMIVLLLGAVDSPQEFVYFQF